MPEPIFWLMIMLYVGFPLFVCVLAVIVNVWCWSTGTWPEFVWALRRYVYGHKTGKVP